MNVHKVVSNFFRNFITPNNILTIPYRILSELNWFNGMAQPSLIYSKSISLLLYRQNGISNYTLQNKS